MSQIQNTLAMIDEIEKDSPQETVQALKELVADGRVEVLPEFVIDELTGQGRIELLYRAIEPSVEENDTEPDAGWSQ